MWSVRLRLQNEKMRQTNLLSCEITAVHDLQGNSKDRSQRRSACSCNNHSHASNVDQLQKTNRTPRRSKPRTRASCFCHQFHRQRKPGKGKKGPMGSERTRYKKTESSFFFFRSSTSPRLPPTTRGIRLVSFVVLEY